MTRKIPQRSGTKKEMIAKMLLDTDKKYTAREIARKVGTTEGNVFKEKSRLKAIGTITDKRLSVYSHSDGDEILTMAHAEAKTLIAHYDSGPLTDIPPIKPDDLMKMYADFQGGRSPVEVIAENGFDPKLVEFEYIRFRRMNGLNLKSLGSDLIERFNLGSGEESNHLVQKMARDGIASNEDIKKVVEIVSNSSHSNGELSVIERMRKCDSVGTFRPLTCSLCHNPIRGILVEDDSPIFRKLLQAMGQRGIVHDECNMGALG